MEDVHEYYLLCYGVEPCESTGRESPDLIYSACLGNLPDIIAECFALEYKIAYGNQSTLIYNYSVDKRFDETFPNKGFSRPILVIRPSLSFDDSMAFLCAKAMDRFDRESKSDTPNGVIEFMQQITQIVDNYKKKFLPPATNIPAPKPATQTMTVVVQRAKGESADKKLSRVIEEQPECVCWTSKQLGKLIDIPEATIRKTKTWKALSRKQAAIKIDNKKRLRMNNEQLSLEERRKIGKALNDSQNECET